MIHYPHACWHTTQTDWSPCAAVLGHVRAYTHAHDPHHLHLGIWDVAADAAPPERSVLLSRGCDPQWVLPVEQAAGAFTLKPTRKYGRRFLAQSDTVAVPGVLDADRIVRPTASQYQTATRPLESDLGTLCAALMRGFVYKRQEGKPARVVTLGYRVPPANPWSQVYGLFDKLNAMDRWARGFARDYRVPLLLAELVGDAAFEPHVCESGPYDGKPCGIFQGHRIARVASILTTDEAVGNEFAMLARFNLS